MRTIVAKRQVLHQNACNNYAHLLTKLIGIKGKLQCKVQQQIDKLTSPFRNSKIPMATAF